MKGDVSNTKKGFTLVEISVTIAVFFIILAETLGFCSMVRSETLETSSLSKSVRRVTSVAEMIRNDFYRGDVKDKPITVDGSEDLAHWGEYWTERAKTIYHCDTMVSVTFTAVKYGDDGNLAQGRVSDGDPVVCTMTYHQFKPDDDHIKTYRFVLTRRTDGPRPSPQDIVTP